MTVARDEILARIRAISRVAPKPHSPTYRRGSTFTAGERVARFCERVADYRAEVRLVTPSDVAAEIDQSLERHAARKIGIPPGLPSSWLPANAERILDHGLTAQELDRLDGVLTGCTAAIAETGTIVLSAGPTEGRRALTLVPDLHLCVVRESQIVGSVPEAIASLEGLVKSKQRPITFISGPSATSDIELSRVEGVHGPRVLIVLIVSGQRMKLGR
jgi:L-lactate dehydrogenase complex protein LldG